MATTGKSNGGIARIVIGVFVVALLAAIAWVIIEQSGVLPGDSGGQPGTIVSE